MADVDPYLHAALVLYGAGKEITQEGLVSVLKAAGAEVDDAKAKVLSEAVKGANMEDLLKAATVVAAAPAPTAPSGGETKKEEKKDEVSEEKKEEQAAEGLANLFG